MVLINHSYSRGQIRQAVEGLIKHLIVLTELATPLGVAILPRDFVSKPYHLFLPSFLL